MSDIKRKWRGRVITGDETVVQHVIEARETCRTNEKWGAGDERMVRLCRGFPTLRGVPGTERETPA